MTLVKRDSHYHYPGRQVQAAAGAIANAAGAAAPAAVHQAAAAPQPILPAFQAANGQAANANAQAAAQPQPMEDADGKEYKHNPARLN